MMSPAHSIIYWKGGGGNNGRGGSFFFNINYTSMFREQVTSALAGFHAGPLSWLH